MALKEVVTSEALTLGMHWYEREHEVGVELVEAGLEMQAPHHKIWHALSLRRAVGVAQYGIDGGYMDRQFTEVDNEILCELLDQINWCAFALVKLRLENSEKWTSVRRKLYQGFIKRALADIKVLVQLEPLHY